MLEKLSQKRAQCWQHFLKQGMKNTCNMLRRSCSISLKNFQVQQRVCRETVDMKTMAEEVNHRIMVMALIILLH